MAQEDWAYFEGEPSHACACSSCINPNGRARSSTHTLLGVLSAAAPLCHTSVCTPTAYTRRAPWPFHHPQHQQVQLLLQLSVFYARKVHPNFKQSLSQWSPSSAISASRHTDRHTHTPLCTRHRTLQHQVAFCCLWLLTQPHPVTLHRGCLVAAITGPFQAEKRGKHCKAWGGCLADACQALLRAGLLRGCRPSCILSLHEARIALSHSRFAGTMRLRKHS